MIENNNFSRPVGMFLSSCLMTCFFGSIEILHLTLREPLLNMATIDDIESQYNKLRLEEEEGGGVTVVGIMDFDPASLFRRSKRIKTQKRPKHPYTNMDLGLKSSL